MKFRIACMHDLAELKNVYKKIVQDMDSKQLQIWDDIYPCEYLEEDIKHNRLYVLSERGVIVSAFALCDENSGENAVDWEDGKAKALYLDRFGVNVDYLKKGIGSFMLLKAKEIAKAKGATYLRLFVVDMNEPAINLYEKNGFSKLQGTYYESIDDNLVLCEYAYEIEI